MKIIGIIGARNRNSNEDLELVNKKFEEIYEDGDKICSGGCRLGGDRFAEIIAKEKNVEIIIFKPDWNKFGKSAGYKRNGKIAETSDVLIACVSKTRLGGTEDTIKKFKLTHPNNSIYLV